MTPPSVLVVKPSSLGDIVHALPAVHYLKVIFQDRFQDRSNGLSLVNQTDLAELIWLLRQSSFIVSVDSGPMHIAAAITPEVLSTHTWSDPGAVGSYIPEAWIWKAKRVSQVRSNRSGESWKASEERPDIFQIREFCPRPDVALTSRRRYWIKHAFFRHRLRSGQTRD